MKIPAKTDWVVVTSLSALAIPTVSPTLAMAPLFGMLGGILSNLKRTNS